MNAPEVPLATRARSVGVELRGATRALALALHPCLAQHPLDGGVMDPELGGDGPYPPVLDDVVAQDLRLELVVERHRARRSVPGATPSASSYRRATPLPTDELADRARAEVAVHLGSAARCASSLDGRFGRHWRIGLAHRNSMRGEFSIARGASGTVMRHFVRARAFAAPAPVAPLALGMTVPAAPRVLIPASRPAQRFTPSEAAAARPAVVLAPVTARADEHLAPASGTEKQSGIVHRSSRRGGLDDPRSPGNTALGAVRKCGSGRSLGRDRQVSAVRGCVSLLADSDLTPTHQRCHRRYARRACPLAGSIGSGGKQRHVPGARGGTIQRWFASTGTVSSRGLFAIYPRIFTATNSGPSHRAWGCLCALSPLCASAPRAGRLGRGLAPDTAGALTIEGQVRTLLAHAESGYEEWGASGAILVASSASGRGLTLRLAPAWGTASDRTEHLWSAHDTTAPAIGEEFEAEGRGRFDMAVLARTIGEVALHRCPIGSPAPWAPSHPDSGARVRAHRNRSPRE